jgi:short-subunit dehydrogenase
MKEKKEAVLISGGNQGIGLSIARIFARNTDYALLLTARNEKKLGEAADQLEKEGAEEVHILPADLSDEKEIQAIRLPEHLTLKILINNAGSYLHGSLQDTNRQDFILQFELNTLTAYHLTSRFLTELKQQDRAYIINICSQASLEGKDDAGAYTMAKHALLGYTRSLREELKQSNVAVTAINLGQTFSPSWDGQDVDPKKLIHPEDVGRIALMITQLSPQTVIEEISVMPQEGELKN